ncbi:NAD(P)/FAD-dependent oxidoreductase [Agaricicola taiwanensis]|nr:NAD(P)/FAD-dependent oxidoreductase [Agaricicola taiwanensis]
MTLRPRIVIVGGGFGGLETAKALAEKDVDVTLVDQQNHHCFQPLLYQVATAALSPADIAWPIRSILKGQSNTTVLMAEVTGIDTSARTVSASGRQIPYDYLVIATGATHSYFGHDEWQDAAPGLKRIEDATHIRRRTLLAFERAEFSTDEAEKQRLMTFAIVGGGPTGVEMAGAISEVAGRILPADFRHVDPRTARVVLIEAGPRILPAFPEDLSAYAHRSLEDMGVEVMVNTRVTGCDDGGVDLGDRRLETGCTIWAAGVVASPAGKWLQAPTDRAGRIEVRDDLTVPGHQEIFAIGDTASIKQANGTPVPGIAPAAKQMGQHAAAEIIGRLNGKAPTAFTYRHQGDLATIGRKSAIVKLKRTKLTGFPAWLFWSLIHVYFLIGLRYRIGVAWKWAWDYLSVQRGARLITRSVKDEPPTAHKNGASHDAAA